MHYFKFDNHPFVKVKAKGGMFYGAVMESDERYLTLVRSARKARCLELPQLLLIDWNVIQTIEYLDKENTT